MFLNWVVFSTGKHSFNPFEVENTKIYEQQQTKHEFPIILDQLIRGLLKHKSIQFLIGRIIGFTEYLVAETNFPIEK